LNRRLKIVLGLVCVLALVTLAVVLCFHFRPSETSPSGSSERGTGKSVVVKNGERLVNVPLDGLPSIRGTVAYQGPVLQENEENWKGAHAYAGVPLMALLNEVGGIVKGDRVAVIATDRWMKELPYEVVLGETTCGDVILALSRDGLDGDTWEDAPLLVFLPEDERFSNADMLTAFGDALVHEYMGHPSTTGFLVKNVAYLIVNYDDGPLPETEQNERN
jgi:hypothetical protein